LLSWDLRCITLLIGSCYLPVMTNAFHCHPALCALFVSLVGVLVTAVLVVSAPGPAGRAFAAPGAKWLRLGVYGSLGGFGVVPIATAVWVRGWGAATQEQVSEVLMGTVPAIQMPIPLFAGFVYFLHHILLIRTLFFLF
jgi:predicted membrane channel-forming protein YqfA (hemolysin III family)